MENINSIAQSLQGSAKDIGESVVSTSMSVIVAVVVLIVGWVIGILVSKVIEKAIKTIQLDKLLSSAGVDDLVKKMGMRLNSGKFIGEIGKWYVIVVSLLMSFDILNLSEVTDFLQKIALQYLPQVITAVFILIIAAVVSEFVRKVVVAGSKGAGVSSANFIGQVAKWSIWIFGILVALFELGVAATLIQTLFVGVVIALALALGLSFGLGGQDAAKDFISKMKRELQDITHHRD